MKKSWMFNGGYLGRAFGALIFANFAFIAQASGNSFPDVCAGCMPRTGITYDSTNVTPSPSFKTTASTGNVYLPPRVVEVQVPVVPVYPTSFPASFLTCSFAQGTGTTAMTYAISQLGYKEGSLARCADDQYTWWLAKFETHLAGKYDARYGVSYKQNMSQVAVNDDFLLWDSIKTLRSSVGSDIDRTGMDLKCSAAATSFGYPSPSSYRLSYSTTNPICSK